MRGTQPKRTLRSMASCENYTEPYTRHAEPASFTGILLRLEAERRQSSQWGVHTPRSSQRPWQGPGAPNEVALDV